MFGLDSMVSQVLEIITLDMALTLRLAPRVVDPKGKVQAVVDSPIGRKHAYLWTFTSRSSSGEAQNPISLI